MQRFTGHTQEGFALDWSSVVEGKYVHLVPFAARYLLTRAWMCSLLSGDNAGRIHYWTSGAAEWSIDQTPFVGHTSSVEDLQWSPSEATVSCPYQANEASEWCCRTNRERTCDDRYSRRARQTSTFASGTRARRTARRCICMRTSRTSTS